MNDLYKYKIDPNVDLKSHKDYEDLRIPIGESNELFRSLVKTDEAFCVAKLGMVETMSLRRFLLGKQLGSPANYNPIANLMYVNAGIFPPEQSEFDRFNEEFLSHIKDLDFLGVWMFGNEPETVTEKEVYERYAKKSRLVHAGSWDPHTAVLNGSEIAWTKELEGKTVLVISPFVKTIKEQYRKREKIWSNPSILPQYNLKVIKAPLSSALKKSSFFSWIDGLNNMKEQMNSTEFDVCFVGAGAWGLPLAVHAKRLGKIGLHSGGDLQLMYGIKGGRWDNNAYIKESSNQDWTRPSEEETPANNWHVEGGCYW